MRLVVPPVNRCEYQKHFAMPKSFYDINETNNVFYYRNTGNSTNIQIVLNEGDYMASSWLRGTTSRESHLRLGWNGAYLYICSDHTNFHVGYPRRTRVGSSLVFLISQRRFLNITRTPMSLGGTPTTDV